MWKTIYIAHTEEQAKKIKQMLNRRTFVKKASLGAGFFMLPNSLSFFMKNTEFKSKRPVSEKRKFISEAVEKEIIKIKKQD